MVRLEAAVAARGGQRMLGPVTLSLRGQGITAIMGPNGAGKTTLLKLMHGLERPRAGQVAWDGLSPREQSYVPQKAILLRRSVRENLALPLALRGIARDDRVAQMAARLDLTDILEAHAPRISGGQAQKLALARALITEPKLVFLDEPTANLDAPTVRKIEGILVEEAARGTRIVLATHGVGQARRLARDVIWLENGGATGPVPAEAFFADPPETARAFMEVQG